jgi:hypothetical protein
MSSHNPLSSGANPRLARLCDRIARLGGRLVAALLDETIRELETGTPPRHAAERALQRLGAADEHLLRRAGALSWPPTVQPVPADLRQPTAAPAPSAGPPTGGPPQTRSFMPGRRAA